MRHVPVLLDSVLNYLDVRLNQDYIDATFGGGGYTKAILKRNAPHGRVLAIDWDEEAVKRARRKFSKNLTVVCGNFRDIEQIAAAHSFENVAGAVFDLGLSSELIERSGRGFSYLRDEPLLMRYSRTDADSTRTARTIVNSYSVKELERIFEEYGEERQAKKISEAIVEQRKKKRIETTGELIAAIERVNRSIKTKARIFQALRIETNQEIENLKLGLAGAWRILTQNGRLVVVSYHSLEDRIIKEFFTQRDHEDKGRALTAKPIKPSIEEIRHNRRARSAKLRAIRKLTTHY